MRRDRDRGERIERVVRPGIGTDQPCSLRAPPFTCAVKRRIEMGRVAFDADRLKDEIGILAFAVGQQPAAIGAKVQSLDHIPHDRMIDADDGQPEEGNVLQKGFVFAVHRFHRAEIVEVLGIDIRDDADFGRQPRERAVALIRLDDHPFALPEPRVRSPGVDDAAGDDGRLLARFREDVREQRCRRRLAVRAGDRDRRIEPHQLGEHFGAADDRQPLLTCRDNSGLSGFTAVEMTT